MVDSALELIPKELGKFSAVGKNIKKYGDAGKILDINLHHSAMSKLKDKGSRGRPDIIHHFLMDSLSSPLNKWNLLRIYVHTRSTNKIYEFNPLMRTPKISNRFKGVIFKLLTEGSIKIQKSNEINEGGFLKSSKSGTDTSPLKDLFYKPRSLEFNRKTTDKGPPPEFLENGHFFEYNESVLARKMKKSLPKFIEFLNPDSVFRFKQTGTLIKPYEIFNKISPHEHIVALVGGFQSGNFSGSVSDIPNSADVSIFPAKLESWSVVQRILSNLENSVMRYFENN